MNVSQQGDASQRRLVPDPSVWRPEACNARAEAEGLELTDTHWVVLNEIREFFDGNDIPPSHHAICRRVESIGAPFRYNGVYAMTKLFPAGGMRQALRVAGIPDCFCSGC